MKGDAGVCLRPPPPNPDTPHRTVLLGVWESHGHTQTHTWSASKRTWWPPSLTTGVEIHDVDLSDAGTAPRGRSGGGGHGPP